MPSFHTAITHPICSNVGKQLKNCTRQAKNILEHQAVHKHNYPLSIPL